MTTTRIQFVRRVLRGVLPGALLLALAGPALAVTDVSTSSVDVWIRSKLYAIGQIVSESAYNTIITQGSVTIAPAADVTYTAGSRITLSPGFKAEAGSHFNAKIVASAADTDHDGMADSWEMAKFGNLASNPLDDADGDGLSNYAEYNLGTNPNVQETSRSARSGSTPAAWSSLVEADPAKVNLAVGATSGSLSVDGSGAATYSLPLWVVPGTAGMQPQLALNYSSQGGPGVAGMGWSVSGVSSIRRAGKNLINDGAISGVQFNTTDRFYLDGQRLVCVDGSYGVHDSEYRTEVESFSRIAAYGQCGNGPEWFKVWTKAGLIIEFGHDAGARHDLAGETTPLAWMVNKISDTVGNYMEFDYVDGGDGERLISAIRYGKNAISPSHYASVVFSYESRPDGDGSFGYIRGLRYSSNHRLDTIQMYYGSSWVREYDLVYQLSDTGRSLLQKITEKAGNGEVFPSLTFSYTSPPAGFAASNSDDYNPPFALAQDGAPSRGTGFVDLNGDGLPDIVRYHTWNGGVEMVERDTYFNTGSGWSKAGVWADLSSAYLLPHPLADDRKSDTGARFVDFDGDGLVDFVYAYLNSSNGLERGAWRNTGSGWAVASAYLPPTELGQSGKGDIGRRFLDVNGDGLTDIVWNWSSNGTTYKGAYLNTGSGWATAPTWAPTMAIASDGVPNNGGRFIDLNGDGLPDQITSAAGNDQVWRGVALNTGSGWLKLSSTTSPSESVFLPSGFPLIGDDKNPHLGVELVDVNGDGLADCVQSRAGVATQTLLNTGLGWVVDSNYTSPIPLEANAKSAGVAFIDVNGDGLPDLVQGREVTGGRRVYSVYFNTGKGWSAAASPTDSCQLPYVVSNDEHGAGSDMVDLNGDGALDMAWNRLGGDNPIGARLGLRANHSRLQSVTTGLGVTASVTYSRLTLPGTYVRGGALDSADTFSVAGVATPVKLVNVVGPMYVVGSVNHDSGTSGVTLRTDYTYGGLRSHRLRGSLGFEWMKSYDVAKDVFSITYYSQTYPFVGMAEGSVTRAITATSPAITEVTLSESEVLFDKLYFNSNQTVLPYAYSSISKSRDLSGDFVSGTKTRTLSFDGYGNVTGLEVESINASGVSTGFKKTTTSSYDNYVDPRAEGTSRWYLGRLSRSTVVATGPDIGLEGGALSTRTSSFTYYASTHGLLASETIEPDDTADGDANPQKVTTAYTYDSAGNKTTVAISGAGLATRSTTTTYDSVGRLPISTSNSLGHTETYGYQTGQYTGLGVPVSLTGPNGLKTSWTYDGFGRKTSETRPDGTQTTVDRLWSRAGTNNVPVDAAFHTLTKVSGGAPAVEFCDKYGRSIAKFGVTGGDLISNTSDAARVVGNTVRYDAFSRPYRSSLPHYLGDTPQLAAYVETYDQLDRPLKSWTANEAVAGALVNLDDGLAGTASYIDTSVTYAGREVTTSVRRLGNNADGSAVNETIRNRTTKDSEGRVVSTINNLDGTGAQRGEIAYVYDAGGQLRQTKVRREDDVWFATTLTYDTRGRKVSMEDPEMGTWEYRYNAVGELLWQKDAKNQQTTLVYDALGRMTSRVEAEGTTTWTYDTAARDDATWLGMIAAVSAPAGNTALTTSATQETYTYDSAGRPSVIKRCIGGQWFATSQGYDTVGRLALIRYPNGPAATAEAANVGYVVRQVYGALGFLQEVRQETSGLSGIFPGNTPNGHIFWQADFYDVAGRISGWTYGNGVSTDAIRTEETGRTQSIHVGFFNRLQGADLHYATSYSFLYDTLGNVTFRGDSVLNYEDRYGYDNLNRLTAHQRKPVGGTAVTRTLTYDALGNIKSKWVTPNDPTGVSGVQSAYTYADGARPRRLTSASGYLSTLVYDGNGNITSDSSGRSLEWTSFNQVKKVARGGNQSEFAFDAAHQRVLQKAGNTTTTYVGSLFERVQNGSFEEWRYYIYSPVGRIAVRSEVVRTAANQQDGLRIDTRYLHQDHLGSIVAVSSETGAIVQRFAYDPWGVKRVELNKDTGAGKLTRGYTDHEHLDDVGLIHMNGRVYDPVLGRFMSADPFVDDAKDSQSYNRYSYVSNNPLNATDPSGYFKLKDFITVVIAVVVTAVVTVLTAGGATALMTAFWSTLTNAGFGAVVAGGAAGGFASGFSGSLLNGGSIGDAFKAGVIGAAVGAATAWAAQGIGSYFDDAMKGSGFFSDNVSNWAGRGLAHGFVGGVASEAQGGQFRHGFYSSFASAGVMHMKAVQGFMGGEKGGAWIAARTATAAAVGGTASVLGGGKFANGATTAAFQHLFNAEGPKYLKAQDDRKYYLGFAAVQKDDADFVGHGFLVFQGEGKVFARGFYPAADAKGLRRMYSPGSVRNDTKDLLDLQDGQLQGAIHWVEVDRAVLADAWDAMQARAGTQYNLAVSQCATNASELFYRFTGVNYTIGKTPFDMIGLMRANSLTDERIQLYGK